MRIILAAMLLLVSSGFAAERDDFLNAGLILRQRAYSASQAASRLNLLVLRTRAAAPAAGPVLADMSILLDSEVSDPRLISGGIGPRLVLIRKNLERGILDLSGSPRECGVGSLADWERAGVAADQIRQAAAAVVSVRERVEQIRLMHTRLLPHIAALRAKSSSEPGARALENLALEYQRSLHNISVLLDAGLRPAAFRDAAWDPRESCGTDQVQGRVEARLAGSAYSGSIPGGSDMRGSNSALIHTLPGKGRGPAVNAQDSGPVTLPSILPGGAVIMAKYLEYQNAAYERAYAVLDRMGWGAAPRRGTDRLMNPSRMTVHHTAGHTPFGLKETAQTMRNIQHYHMVGRALEGKDAFEDIGYHFLIAGDGRVAQGRKSNVHGAHAAAANTDNIGIALMGDFTAKSPTPDQLESLRRLVVYLSAKYRIDPRKSGALEGHRHFASTSCPGTRLYGLIGQIRSSAGLDLASAKKLIPPEVF